MTGAEKQSFCARIAAATGLHARLAHRIVAAGICSLEDLEMAAYDGRLARIPGFGRRRVEQVKHRLERHFGYEPSRAAPSGPRPPVATLLDIDAEYRRLAADGALPRYSPQRFNPDNQAWLPVWHTERDGFAFTVMFSNTARAYRLGKRRDWVIIVYERDGRDNHCTVVTEHEGGLAGERVVRGRERECREVRKNQPVSPDVRAWLRDQLSRL